MFRLRSVSVLVGVLLVWERLGNVAYAQEAGGPGPQLDVMELIRAGGVIGYIIMGLSLWMIALIVEYLLSFRRSVLMPIGLAEELHRLIGLGQFKQAEQQCKQQPSYLGYVVSAGVAEVGLGYRAVEKAMEDASVEQASRLFRRIEYLSVIGTVAPMLGLLGTVWGMILAFMEFEAKANPQVSELAPGIYRALVTTFQGLCVAIPALAAYAFFRNRVDELSAQTTLMAEHVFSNYKRTVGREPARSRPARPARSPMPPLPTPSSPEGDGGNAPPPG